MSKVKQLINDGQHPLKESYPVFSFFPKPITNTKPSEQVTLIDVYHYIRDPKGKDKLDHYRSMSDDEKKKNFKRSNFDFATFSGVFAKRANDDLISHSGYICVDIDDVDVEPLFDNLKQDEHTELLFRSPSGKGLKWIVEVEISSFEHQDYFKYLQHYIGKHYHVSIDQSGKDVARSCFLCYDDNAFINPKYL